VKNLAQSGVKPFKITCDRCQQVIEGIRGKGFISGIYDMTTWQEYRRGDERHVCTGCMFADEKYVARYGSCF
jgi:hypothetical protein